MKRLKDFFIIHSITPYGEYRYKYKETIIAYIVVLLIILLVAFCVNPHESANWYGQPGTGG
jgi:hypothetical protein